MNRILGPLLIFLFATHRFAHCEDPVASNEWLTLFNGHDLSNWVAEGDREYIHDKDSTHRPVWSVRDGLLRCDGHGFGFLRYDRKFSDFVYHLEFRMSKDCNSGIGVRHVKYVGGDQSTPTRPSNSGYEIQILDDAGKEPNEHCSGSLYRYVAPSSIAVHEAGQWNAIDIECVGPRIRITLNEQRIMDYDQSKQESTANKPLLGYVSLQNHDRLIEFRSIRIKELTTESVK